jgi:hypothetical protein
MRSIRARGCSGEEGRAAPTHILGIQPIRLRGERQGWPPPLHPHPWALPLGTPNIRLRGGRQGWTATPAPPARGAATPKGHPTPKRCDRGHNPGLHAPAAATAVWQHHKHPFMHKGMRRCAWLCGSTTSIHSCTKACGDALDSVIAPHAGGLGGRRPTQRGAWEAAPTHSTVVRSDLVGQISPPADRARRSRPSCDQRRRLYRGGAAAPWPCGSR